MEVLGVGVFFQRQNHGQVYLQSNEQHGVKQKFNHSWHLNSTQLLSLPPYQEGEGIWRVKVRILAWDKDGLMGKGKVLHARKAKEKSSILSMTALTCSSWKSSLQHPPAPSHQGFWALHWMRWKFCEMHLLALCDADLSCLLLRGISCFSPCLWQPQFCENCHLLF